MKHLRQIVMVSLATIMLPTIAWANMGPAIAVKYGIHLMFLTWVIAIGESILLATLFRTWKLMIYVYMMAANVTSAWLGMRFVNSGYAAQFMGDVTIENLIPTFWNMVYVTFFLTMFIEFPFFLAALYGKQWLVPKAVAATIFVHCISYSLLFFFYNGETSMNLVTELEVVPATAFIVEEDYDLFYISPDGKHVMRSDLMGKETEIIATLDLDGGPDRLETCLRKVVEESMDELGQRDHAPHHCVSCEFDLYVVANGHGVRDAVLLLENFSPDAAVHYDSFGYHNLERFEANNYREYPGFRNFGDAENWEFESDFWGVLFLREIKQGSHAYIGSKNQASSWNSYRISTPFVQWSVQNGSHIAGDYGVFKLGEDQICILDPEKKRIALIARGFGPVVSKPFLEARAEEVMQSVKFGSGRPETAIDEAF